jgi:hypothetical protein
MRKKTDLTLKTDVFVAELSLLFKNELHSLKLYGSYIQNDTISFVLFDYILRQNEGCFVAMLKVLKNFNFWCVTMKKSYQTFILKS